MDDYQPPINLGIDISNQFIKDDEIKQQKIRKRKFKAIKAKLKNVKIKPRTKSKK